MTEDGVPVNYNKIMISDSIATCTGAFLGTSTVTTFVESGAGISAGGKTGLTALVTAGLFLLSIFVLPLFASIPGAAVDAALVYVGCLMLKGVKDIKVGQNVYITGDAFEGVTYTGTVKYIAPIAFQAQSMQGSETYIEVIIDVNETETLLKNGLNVTCDIVSNRKEDVLTIPLGSFTEDNDNNKFVYVVENGAIKKTQVEVGLNSEEELEIISGVPEGVEITRETKSTYEDGMKVTIKKEFK
jgi:multidrug efflux pump subunit AcrA (membrane-fusion protein)